MRPFKIIESVVRRSLAAPIRLSLKPFARSPHEIGRYFMYEHLAQILKNEKRSGEVLSISGSNFLSGFINSDSDKIVEADYPDYNMLDLPFENDRFDAVVSDQVLEHVEGNPFKAVEESYRVLKPGGIAVHATCLLMQIHGYPSDFWRFTPNGLKLLCQDFSEIIDSGGWGNRYLWGLSWLGVFYGEGVPESSRHPYNKIARHNEENYPIVTWVVAKK